MYHQEKGIAAPSFTKHILEDLGEGIIPAEEDVLRWTAASMYLGGADTTVSAIHTFFLAMTMYPHIQARAQEELDDILHGERLPTFSDVMEERFPYVQALMKEVLRWGPVARAGAPHLSRDEDEYRGWYIPKGTLVIENIWCVLIIFEMI